MKYTAKHDRGLVDGVIGDYNKYLENPLTTSILSAHYCAFCLDIMINCKECVLKRRFGKKCTGYKSFRDIEFSINRYGYVPKPFIKKRIAVLKRLKHYIKGEINV